MALVAVVLSTGSACGGEASSLSSGEMQRDAKVILRGDLTLGSTGETAARIVRGFGGVEGVWGTRGDDGRHVWVYGTADVTPEQVLSIRRHLEGLSSVESVTQVR